MKIILYIDIEGEERILIYKKTEFFNWDDIKDDVTTIVEIDIPRDIEEKIDASHFTINGIFREI